VQGSLGSDRGEDGGKGGDTLSAAPGDAAPAGKAESRPRGKQDPRTNNGQPAITVPISDRDGLLLLRSK
jgi:hypothetical protein